MLKILNPCGVLTKSFKTCSISEYLKLCIYHPNSVKELHNSEVSLKALTLLNQLEVKHGGAKLFLQVVLNNLTPHKLLTKHVVLAFSGFCSQE
jgi:hypothetical protein